MSLDSTNAGTWRKSTRSGGSGAQCVEVRCATGVRHIRDSKAPGAGALGFGSDAFGSFLAGVKAGRHDPS